MTDGPKIDLHIGDNIDVLPTVEGTGTVDVIYIDPPYNTGKKIFSYEDTRSDWEQFMSARIELCYPLLSDSGVILASINDQELHTLRLVMDKVFGKKNFLSTIVWRGKGNSKSKFSCGGIDYIVAYAKKRHLAPAWKEKKEHAHLLIKDVQKSKEKGLTVEEAQSSLRKRIKQIKDLPQGLASYSHVDADYEPYCTSSLVNNLYRPNLKYDMVDPITGRGYPPPEKGWTISKGTFEGLLNEGRIVFKANRPRKKNLLKDMMFQSPYPYIETSRSLGHFELERIIGPNSFKNPKDVAVLKQWINIVSGYKEDAVVLDFFAGSGSTGQAVAELNYDDGGSRSCILVTTNENNIADEITIPRLTRVLSGNWDDNTRQHSKLPNHLVVHRKEGMT